MLSCHRPSRLLGLLLLFVPLTAHAQEYTFTDVTDAAGVADEGHIRWGSNWIDYDKDGRLDLYVVHGEAPACDAPEDANTLYRNNGDGTFTDVTAETGTGDCWVAMRNAWADYDNDGDLDFYSHNFLQSTLYRNDGGVFVDVNATSGAGINMEHGTGAAWADYDNDGDLDFHAVSFPGFNALMRNNGDGTFTDVQSSSGLSFPASAMGNMWADYDNDGDLDLALAAVTPYQTVLYRNEGDGTFTDITVQAGIVTEDGSSGAAVFWADYDNDGFFDLLLTEVILGSTKTTPLRMYLFHNRGDGTFEDKTEAAGLLPPDESGEVSNWDAAFADYDNDGDQDLYVSVQTQTGQGNFFYRNNGDETFTDIAEELGMNIGVGETKSSVWGDYDNDGDLDLFVMEALGKTDPNRLFRNDGGSNHWLQVELVGTCSNRDAIGARLTLTNGGSLQVREVNGGTGLFSQHSPIQQFGLGTDTVADELRIDWPSGLTTTLTDVAADQRLTLVEDACPATVTVSLTPPPGPIVIGGGGGILSYAATLDNATTSTQTFDFWITVDVPGGLTITQGPVSRVMPPGAMTITPDLRVPGSAPAGEYLITAHVGNFPVAEQSDGFSFTKLAASKGPGADPATWDTDLEAFFAPTGGTNESPEAFALMENYPNPFNPSTTITFTTAETGPVRLSVYDLLGRRVTTLVEGVLPAGMHQARWEAGGMAGGVYLYRLEAGGVVRTRRMILMK